MPEANKASSGPGLAETNVPAWLAGGLIGIVVGIGGTLVVVRTLATKHREEVATATAAPPSTPPPMMMMGSPMGGFGGGGGGGARGKTNLSSLVGKLELLTRETLHVDLAPEQSAKIATQLAKLDQAETLTDDAAQEQLSEIEAILTPEQKAKLDSIRLPFNRPAGGGPGGPGGGPGGPGGGGPMMGGMGGGMGGGAPDENPFRRDSNQKQLRDLLARIDPSSAKPPSSTPTTADVKADAEEATASAASETATVATESDKSARATETPAAESPK